MANLITNTNKSGSTTATFATAYTAAPKLALATYAMDAAAGSIMDYYLNATKASSSITISFTVSTSTTINSLKISYLTVDSAVTTISAYNGGTFQSNVPSSTPLT